MSPRLLTVCLIALLALGLGADARRKSPHHHRRSPRSPKLRSPPPLPQSPPPLPPPSPAPGGPPFNGTRPQNGTQGFNGTMPGPLPQNGTQGGFNGTVPGPTATPSPTSSNSTSGATNVTYELEVGPYEVVAEETDAYNKSDVAEDQAGFPITYTITVVNISGSPMQGVRLDYWAANAQGLYSDEAAIGTSGTDYLRGWQVTNAQGVARFLSIFSGRYVGRTTHVHLRVRIYGSGGAATYDHTTQMFFPQEVADEILSVPAYARTNAAILTSNSNDRIYHLANQVSLTGSIADGWFAATYTIHLPLIAA